MGGFPRKLTYFPFPRKRESPCFAAFGGDSRLRRWSREIPAFAGMGVGFFIWGDLGDLGGMGDLGGGESGRGICDNFLHSREN